MKSCGCRVSRGCHGAKKMCKRSRSDSDASYAKRELEAAPQNICSARLVVNLKMSSTHSAIFYSGIPRKIVTTNIDMLRSPSSPLQPFLGLFSSTHKSPRLAPDSTSRPSENQVASRVYLLRPHGVMLRPMRVFDSHQHCVRQRRRIHSSFAQPRRYGDTCSCSHSPMSKANPFQARRRSSQNVSTKSSTFNHHVRIIYYLGCIHAAVTGFVGLFSKPNLTPHISYRRTSLARN